MAELRYLEDVITLEYNQERCIGCGMCAIVCPHTVFTVRDGKAAVTGRDHCMECGACMRNCPAGAIEVEAGEGCVRAIIYELLGIDKPCC